jgi:hypothetical protein
MTQIEEIARRYGYKNVGEVWDGASMAAYGSLAEYK